MSESYRKRPLTAEQAAECRALHAIYESNKRRLGITYEIVGHELGITPGAVGHYLRGRNALNVQVAIGFSKILQVPVEDFSPRLSEVIGNSDSPIKQQIIDLLNRLPDDERLFQLKQLRDRVEFLESQKSE